MIVGVVFFVLALGRVTAQGAGDGDTELKSKLFVVKIN